jgi:myo-inositol-1(or 4)-monophosphatase
MPISDKQMVEFSNVSREAARRGGDVLLKWLGKTTPREKGFRDLVTQADLESQSVIQDFLLKSFPGHQFLGEESVPETGLAGFEQDYCWIVDPLDGTTNYVHQLRSFSVSIALRHDNETLVGTVLDPVLKECYWAIKGHGAQLNDKRIETSNMTDLEKSLFVFSFGREQKTRDHPEVVRFLNMLEKVGSLRRLGSAALNLCYIACGRLDGYWATSLQPWDVAAGWLIATEAGATLADFEGRDLEFENPKFCITATPELFEQAEPLLNI